MDIEATSTGGATLLRARGRMDSSNSAEFEAALLPRIRGGERRVALDISKVDYISSAGLRIVLLGAKAAKAAGGLLVLFGLSSAVNEVFQVSGFSQIIPIRNSEAEALAAFGT